MSFGALGEKNVDLIYSAIKSEYPNLDKATIATYLASARRGYKAS